MQYMNMRTAQAFSKCTIEFQTQIEHMQMYMCTYCPVEIYLDVISLRSQKQKSFYPICITLHHSGSIVV